MRRVAGAIAALSVCAFAAATPAAAATREATVGNYYYEDDARGDRTSIVVHQGDQVRFTVREAAYPPHTVDVDELNIHSQDLIVGQTFVTPALKTVGNFYLYCRPHEQRGHHTRLIVLAAAPKTALPAPAGSHPTSRPAHAAVRRATPGAAASPAATLTPVGVGTAPPEAMARPLATDPRSLATLTGHPTSNSAPWTRSLWWLAIAAVPVIGAAAYALRRARIAEYQPKFENVIRVRETTRTPSKPRPSAGSKSAKPRTPRRGSS